MDAPTIGAARIWITIGVVLGVALAGAAPARAQLVAHGDHYAVPYGEPLEVEPLGVLENDTLDGEPAGESGATAELVVDVAHGTLVLGADGSLSYTPGPGFGGSDAFTYRAVAGLATAEATVTLSACSDGPEIITCWKEAAFRARAAELGIPTLEEGFEDDAVWGGTRTPDSAPSVTTRGLLWQANHPEPPASNGLVTTSGPPHSGLWAIYEENHGYATGTPSECDIDMPPRHCLYYDGITGTLLGTPGQLRGAGAYFTGTFGANVAVVLDDDEPGQIVLGKPAAGHQFFGVLDAGTTGFSRFSFREIDGKVGQSLFIWMDDFVLASPAFEAQPVPSVPLAALFILAASSMLALRRRRAPSRPRAVERNRIEV